MKKFEVLKEFSYNDKTYYVGDFDELVDHVVENLGGRGYLKVSDETPKPEKEDKSYSFLSKKDKKKSKRSHSSG